MSNRQRIIPKAPSAKDVLRFSKLLRAEENQKLHDWANCPGNMHRSADESHHWQRLLAWDVLIGDIKEGLPAEKALNAFEALAYGEAAQ